MTMANERSSDPAAYLGWFLFGTALGAAAAFLLTPKTGEQARQLLSEQSSEWAKRAQDIAHEAQGRAGQWLDKSRELFEEQTQRLMSAFEAGKEAMREETRRSDPRA
jgi:gas vesicle protein